jgi:hypothetical protein
VVYRTGLREGDYVVAVGGRRVDTWDQIFAQADRFPRKHPLPIVARPAAEQAAPLSALVQMPIREVTIFKDGHAFVLHQGKVPTDAGGRVVLDYLPVPVVGTFWAYSADPKIKLRSVSAGTRRVSIMRTSLSIPELIEGNIGAKVRIHERKPVPFERVVYGREVPEAAGARIARADAAVLAPGTAPTDVVYEATILGVPTRSAEELARTSAPGSPERLPEKGGLVLLKTAEGVRAVPISRIEEITFVGEPKPEVASEEFRNLLTLDLDWGNRKPEKAADVGMVYLQKGLRWIPEYRVEIDGKGGAHLKLQATLINELADLVDAKAHLVIGVPTFAFQDTVDPISLQQAVAQLSTHFRRDAQTAFAFSNAIMSQQAMPVERLVPEEGARPGGRVIDLGPDISGGKKSEDLYIFTLDHVTLKKGERIVLPVAEYDLAYKDIYSLNLPFGPPAELRHRINNEQQLQLARLMLAPKVMHSIRMTNKGEVPLTTAPALILRDGRLVAQGLMKYTAVGATSDLELTAAVDIASEKTDKETGRTPNAATWHNQSYDRIDLVGSIHLVNRRAGPVDIEVTRHVLGAMDGADHDGKTEQMGWSEGGWLAAADLPPWWYWCGWEDWWYHFNGIGRATWKVTLEPGKAVDLEYKWHYFWR